MAVVAGTYYTLVCDQCGELMELDEGGYVIAADENEVKELVSQRDWRDEDGKLTCSVCLEETRP
jgi:formylmethanofuran dehydrogenase subunit E